MSTARPRFRGRATIITGAARGQGRSHPAVAALFGDGEHITGVALRVAAGVLAR